MGDLLTFHDYSPADKLPEICATFEGIMAPKSDRPVVCAALPGKDNSRAWFSTPHPPILLTEFGGINISRPGEKPPNDKDWGYSAASDGKDLAAKIRQMVMGIAEGGLICGFVYTQL